MTDDRLAAYLREIIGVAFSVEEVERLRPLVEQQNERLRKLESLDLGADDPREMHYIIDHRLSR